MTGAWAQINGFLPSKVPLKLSNKFKEKIWHEGGRVKDFSLSLLLEAFLSWRSVVEIVFNVLG
jgi:hypothetical protein